MTGRRSCGEDLLRWASENAAGTWTALSDAAANTMTGRGEQRVRPWQLAADLAMLGHIDIDWGNGRWSAAPPCLVLARDLGLCSFLAGWRTSALMHRYDELLTDSDVFPFEIQQGIGPIGVFAKFGSVELLEEIADRLNVPVVFDAAAQLADLTSLEDAPLVPGAPPPVDEDLFLLDERHLAWNPVQDRHAPGLYRFELHGRKAFRLQREDWYIVDRAVGQLHVLQGRTDVISWHPPSPDLTTPRAMTVRSSVSIPPIAERAAVASSGLLPIRTVSRRIYRNVQRATAQRIAEGLGLVLSVQTSPVQEG